MPTRKVREINLTESKGTFSILKSSKSKEEYNFSGITALRQLFSNEKAKILHTIKTENPSSIYDLAKKLGRGFKIVFEDSKLLERFGFIEFVEERTKNRIRHRPILSANSVTIHINL
jgi:predicted transcriptional regulator